jgi:hypothetical protein
MKETHLLDLPDGHLSLEVASNDRNKVTETIIRLFGKPRIELLAPSGSIHFFGGAEFIFQDERDDPCLMSRSDEGDAILRQLIEALKPS